MQIEGSRTRPRASGTSLNLSARRYRGFGAARGSVPAALELQAPPRAPVVLFVEDDDEFRALVASHLRNHGYRVIESGDGRELLRRIEAYRDAGTPPGFDLAICDVYLPGASGLELLERMNRAGIELPMILLSGFGDFHTCVQAASKRAAAFFPKPIELDRLLSAARALIWKTS